jgi:hypothetical protein
MAELIKKQVVTEVIQLTEYGAVTITNDPERPLFQRYKAEGYKAEGQHVFAYGYSVEAAINRLGDEVGRAVNQVEHLINTAKNQIKEHTNRLRTLKITASEIKLFENPDGQEE